MMREIDGWLTAAQAQLLHGDFYSARATLVQALIDHPDSIELRRALAGIQRQTGQLADAEAMLRELLDEDPGEAGSAFTLARTFKDQGRMTAAASIMRECFAAEPNTRDADLVIQGIELLDDCNRKADAAAIAESAIAKIPDDSRLHAYAGMLAIQLGEFELARRRYLFALEHDERAWAWHVPIGLSSSQRYASSGHTDFALFKGGLARKELSDNARAELHFALGKAFDDVGDYKQATQHFREGNAISHRLTRWSRKAWRRTVETRLAAAPITNRVEPPANFTPVFIVGIPRSGTTLLAELLSHYSRVCNRGELPWIARLAGRVDLSGNPSIQELQQGAATYAMHARQDDVPGARWFIDKQPLNFRYLDLMLAMFPQAKIVYCQRSPRDTALSLWMQCFLEDVQGYAYDFGDIALVQRDCDRLATHWNERYPNSIRTVRYEELVSDPDGCANALAQWIGLPEQRAIDPSWASATSTISTASLWQARQPVNTRSVGRWKHYVPYVSELLQSPE